MFLLNWLAVWANGADGGIDLANAVVDAVENGNADYKRLYSDDDSLEAKITKIVTEIYGGKSVVFEKKAKEPAQTICRIRLG